MRHIPNAITLLNLLFGALAITFILEERIIFHTLTGEDYRPVMNMSKIYWASFFIFLAALMDVIDGLSARLLNARSAIGKDLDSLADVVSFGVAPSMILYKYIQMSYMGEPGALDTPILVTIPAFLLAMFGALRLARYNQIAGENDNFFLGMPIPAVGLIVASIPLISWFPSSFMMNNFPNDYNLSVLFLNRWFLYGLSAILAFLMVSKIKFLKWKPASWTMKDAWPHVLILLTIIIGGLLFHFLVVPLVLIVYVVSSILYFKSK